MLGFSAFLHWSSSDVALQILTQQSNTFLECIECNSFTLMLIHLGKVNVGWQCRRAELDSPVLETLHCNVMKFFLIYVVITVISPTSETRYQNDKHIMILLWWMSHHRYIEAELIITYIMRDDYDLAFLINPCLWLIIAARFTWGLHWQGAVSNTWPEAISTSQQWHC